MVVEVDFRRPGEHVEPASAVQHNITAPPRSFVALQEVALDLIGDYIFVGVASWHQTMAADKGIAMASRCCSGAGERRCAACRRCTPPPLQ